MGWLQQSTRLAQRVLTKYISIRSDITELKRNEPVVRENERLMRIVTENLPGMVAYWTADLRCTFANTAYCRWLGRAADDVVGGHMSELLGEAQFRVDEPWVAGALRGEQKRIELSRQNGDAALTHYWIHYLPDRDGETIKGVISVIIDVTELKAAHARLEELNLALSERTRQAEQASVAKTAFLGNMSHEIRTPLNAMIGFTYLLEKSPLDAEQVGLVGSIKLASRSLLGIVNNVLDLTKIEAGELGIEEAAFNLRELFDELTSQMAVQANAKNLQLVMHLDRQLPPVVRGDAPHLQQLLTNLLSNAIKFTEHGTVTLAVAELERTATRVLVRFAVKDSGIGIAPELQQRLFAPFTQADVSSTRRHGGAGLGLSIVKRLTLLMDGEVSVTSTANVGSEFTVVLPLWVENPLASGPARPLEVLVASDAPEFRTQLSGLARALGWRAEAIGAGPRVLERLQQRLMTVEPVEVLLLAFGAFETTDTQTLTALQAAVARGRMPPVVLVSADGAKPLELPAGFEASIVGGAVSTSVLFNAVQEAVAARARGPSARPASNDQVDHGARALYGKQLLVVDDSEVNLKLAQRILALEGAQVTVAANGQEAVDLLRLAPNAFDAVLMDLQMPMLDGFEATRQIRNVLGLTSLPIVALTAGTLMSERRRATDAGMDDFISKPFVIRAVIDKLVRLLSPAQAEQPQPARVSRSPAVPPSWPVIDGMDAGKSFAAMVGDEALLTDMLARLMAEFADLELPPLAANGGTLTARLHKLSGTAGTMGATMLGNAAKAWELALGRTGGAGAEELGATVARELRRLRVSAQPLLVAGQEPVRAVDVAPDVIARAEPATNLDLDELIGLLKQQSFRALDVFAALTPALRPEIGEHDFAALSTALNALQYERAVSILECTRKCPSAAR